MSVVLKIIAVISLSCVSICTTAIVDKIVFSPLFSERYYEEDFDRSIKAHGIFFFIDLLATISMLVITDEMWVPMIITLVALVFTAAAYHYNNKIVKELATVRLESELRKINTIRAVLYFAKFVCVFGFCISLYIQQ